MNSVALLRELAGLSRLGLGELTGHSATWIGRVERGELTPTEAEAARICAVLGVGGAPALAFPGPADPAEAPISIAIVPALAIVIDPKLRRVHKALALTEHSVQVYTCKDQTIVVGEPRPPWRWPCCWFDAGTATSEALASLVARKAEFFLDVSEAA